jgi:hypothetical protein
MFRRTPLSIHPSWFLGVEHRVLEQTRPLAVSQVLLRLVVDLRPGWGILTFECIARIEIDRSLSIDSKMWCTFRR